MYIVKFTTYGVGQSKKNYFKKFRSRASARRGALGITSANTVKRGWMFVDVRGGWSEALSHGEPKIFTKRIKLNN